MSGLTLLSSSCAALSCLLIVLFVAVVWVDLSYIPNQSVVVPECFIQSSKGQIKGHVVVIENKRVCEYLGIPYASSPTGRRRFAKPAPRPAWKRTLYASSYSPSCPQRFPDWAKWMMRENVRNYSEDCLYLNVWSSSGSCTGKPVLFWIHGGGYQFGAGSLLETNGSVLSALHDVVVVTINYRLNAFGFLSVDDDQIPGNMGLYDQAMALQWVRDNAAAFGADPDSITIWGQGMGSISVSAHLVSPVSRGLFSRAIMQTGSIFSSPEMYSRSNEVANEFISASACGQPAESDDDEVSEREEEEEASKTSEVIECLKQAPLPQLMLAAEKVTQTNPVAFFFTPDEAFFNYSSPNSIKHKLSNVLNPSLRGLLIGFNSDEGSLLLNSLSPQTFPDSGQPRISDLDEAMRFLTQLFTTRLGVAKSIIQTGVNNEFNVNRTSKKEIIKSMIDFVGNNIFVCPTIIFGEEVADSDLRASVHMFTITSRSGYNHLPEWFGTIHNEEVPMMFGMPIALPHEFSPKDVSFSRNLMQTISNFARSG